MEGQNQNTLLHRLSAGEKHRGRTEPEYTITQAISWREKQWKDSIIIYYNTDYQQERNIVEGQNHNTLLHRLSDGEKHSGRTESEYTITQAISWRETQWKDIIRIHYYTSYQLVRNIAEGHNQNTLLHRLSTGDKYSGRTESEYIITQAIKW